MRALAADTIMPGHGAQIQALSIRGLVPMAFAVRLGSCGDREIARYTEIPRAGAAR
jgi:hypothetical protein